MDLILEKDTKTPMIHMQIQEESYTLNKINIQTGIVNT